MAFVVPSWGGDSGGDYGFGGGGEGEAAAPKAAGGKKGAVGDAHVRRLAEVVRRVPKPEKRAATKGDEAKNPTQGKPESEGSLLNHKLKKKKKKTSQPSGREEVGASGATVSSAGQKNKNKNKFKKEKGQALLPAPAEVTQETEQGKAKGKRKKLKAPDDLDDAPAAKRSGAASLLQEGAEAGSKGKGKGDGLLEQMRAKLQGGQFRWLNETMYTQPGGESFRMMREEPDLFKKYHDGFRQQTHGWPKLPVDVAISWLKGKPSSLVVADFGCGDAKLAKEVKQKVHSFDLVSTQPGVIACDMAKTPLEDDSVDVAVFCLALMGTDYPAFLCEATRVLRPGGTLWVAEVRSRFASEGGETEVQGMQKFVAALKCLGYVLRAKDASNRMFVILELTKSGAASGFSGIKWPPLKACTYKRR